MSTTLTGTVTSGVAFTFTSNAALGTSAIAPISETFRKTFASTDVTKVFFANYSVTTTPTSVDISTGLTDVFGTSFGFGVVKQMIIVNNDATNNLTAGGGTTPVFAVLPSIPAGGCINLTINNTVDSTHKLLALTASAGTISVDVVIVGT